MEAQQREEVHKLYDLLASVDAKESSAASRHHETSHQRVHMYPYVTVCGALDEREQLVRALVGKGRLEYAFRVDSYE